MKDDLQENRRDLVASLARAVAGAVPWGGGFLSELFTKIIPGQRVDRIAAYVRALDERLNSLEAVTKDEIFSDPRRIDLIEEGALQAARATAADRIAAIAELVANGLDKGEIETVRHKRLLLLLSEIDDDQLLLLNAYGQSYGGDGSAAWDKVDQPEPTHMGSSLEEFDTRELFQLGRENLLRLGLLKRHFRTPRKGEAPKFDNRTGHFEHSVEISPMGRMLLREVGVKLPLDDE